MEKLVLRSFNNFFQNVIKKHFFIVILVCLILLSVFVAQFISKQGVLLINTLVPGIFGLLCIVLVNNCLLKFKSSKTTIFITRLILITYLIRFLTAFVIYYLEYYVLNTPFEGVVYAIGIDNDNYKYHEGGIAFVDNVMFANLQYYLSLLGLMPPEELTMSDTTQLYSLMIGLIYLVLGVHFFVPIVFNCFVASFVPVLAYLISKEAFISEFKSRLIGYVSALSYTVSAYSAVMMRDVYIMFFLLLCIYLFVRLMNTKNPKYLCFLPIAIFFLAKFREYAAIGLIAAILAAIGSTQAELKINKKTIISTLAFIIVCGVLLVAGKYIGLNYILYLLDVDNIIYISKVGYGGADSSFNIDRSVMASNLPFYYVFGLLCMTFSPFPWQWIQATNIVQLFVINEMVIFYIFIIPSFFYGIYKLFKEKNIALLVCFYYIFFISSFYGLIFDNAGAVFRGRAHFVLLIFIICIYNSKGLLLHIQNLIDKYLNGKTLNIRFKQYVLHKLELY